MKEKIIERLETYREWRSEIIEQIKAANNIHSGRVVKWANDLEKLEIQITELETLLH